MLRRYALSTLIRLFFLVIITVFGTIAIMRSAPGFYSDLRELDPQSGQGVREALALEQEQSENAFTSSWAWLSAAVRGNLGESRQFHIPVKDLLGERCITSLRLLVFSLTAGCSSALVISLFLAIVRRRGLDLLILLPAAWLLVLPVGAIAAFCFLSDRGGPMAVMSVVIAARELQYFRRLIQNTLEESHFLYCRAIGLSLPRILWKFALPQFLPQLLALLLRAFVVAFSMIVPVEVLFDIPGIGQLAWSSTMNRDLPVVVAVSVLFAAILSLLSALSDHRMEGEAV